MSDSHLSLLDVGHGNCAIVRGNTAIVIVDAGRGSALLEYLTRAGIVSVDTVLVSHSDADHVGGLIGLLASNITAVRAVYVNADAMNASRLWDALVYELDHLERRTNIAFETSLVQGKTFPVGPDDVTVNILAPRRYLASIGPGGTDREGRRLSSNSMSAVAMVRSGSKGLALLPGDLDEVGLDHLEETVPASDLRADILVFPHHGGHTGRSGSSSSDEEFAKRLVGIVQPRRVVFSIGRGLNSTPRPEIVRAILSEMPETRIACTQLSTHCAASLPKAVPTHLADVFAAGKQHNRCCAGTMVFSLSATGGDSPDWDQHRDFIRSDTSTPLCMPGKRLK